MNRRDILKSLLLSLFSGWFVKEQPNKGYITFHTDDPKVVLWEHSPNALVLPDPNLPKIGDPYLQTVTWDEMTPVVHTPTIQWVENSGLHNNFRPLKIKNHW